jgi:AcrR family transcriptional regulator
MPRGVSTRSGPPARRPLSEERIVAAALRLIDRRGLGAFSMRALGGELGVQAMSLYRHVPSREAILDGVVRRMLAEAPPPPMESPWHEGLREWARAFRGVALRHPNAFPLFGDRPAVAYLAAREDAERALALMVEEARFTPEEAARALRTVARYVLGFSLAGSSAGPAPAEAAALLAGAGFPLLGTLVAGSGVDGEGDFFEFGLGLVLDGLRDLARPRPARRARPVRRAARSAAED